MTPSNTWSGAAWPMVNVQVGVAREPLVHEVDERLERDALGVVVVGVQRREVASTSRIPRGTRGRPRVPERVALEVEEEVARGRVGQEREAGLRLRLERT